MHYEEKYAIYLKMSVKLGSVAHIEEKLFSTIIYMSSSSLFLDIRYYLNVAIARNSCFLICSPINESHSVLRPLGPVETTE